MPKRTSAADSTPIRVVVVTMDGHLSGVVARAGQLLMAELPGLDFAIHAADEWGSDPVALERCLADIARGDIVIATMLFLDDHIRAVLPALTARRDQCDAMVCCMSAGEVVRLTRLGNFSMSGEAIGALSWLKRLRGKGNGAGSSGRGQMNMLRQLPRLLRFLPGKAQDLRAYFLTLQYWLAGSDANIANLVRLLVERYAEGPRKGLRTRVKAGAPAQYPDIGVYHPAMRKPITTRLEDLPPARRDGIGTVGLLVMRSYLLAGNTGHYDGVISALEARGLRVITAFASGLDARPAIERYFQVKGRPAIDALVSLTGFSLVGGPAYNDAKSAEDVLATLDVPYLAAHPLEFQTIEQWEASERGLTPVEATIMVAIPELDGATGPMVFGGRTSQPGSLSHEMRVHPERASMLAARVAKLVALRRAARADRKIAITLFSFPPNAGNVGTAQHLAVFESLHRTLAVLKRSGYTVDLPADVDALRCALLEGNAARHGTVANVHARIAASDHVRRERYLREIEQQWGPAPGRHQTDGASLFVLGQRFGNVFVGVQPAFGIEGDPMRLLFDRSFAPTHAFSAFYRWMREDFGAHAVLHFGTHGALEFMPGKQVGMSGACWPDRLIGDLPNLYLYAANNPSEGTIAKRRSAATLISYLTPPVAQSGLYAGLIDLRASIDRWRGLAPEAQSEREGLERLIQSQASVLDLAAAEPAWPVDAAAEIARLVTRLAELESTLIPQGLHVLGEAGTAADRVETLLSVAETSHGLRPDRAAVEALVAGASPDAAAAGTAASERERTVLRELAAVDAQLMQDHETPAIVRALDGAYLRPTPGGDLLRTPSILPTGRNVHGFDPFRIPSAYAIEDGARQATRLLERHAAEGVAFPESVALVLWATDNLKSEGAQIGQALALLGAAPRFDSFGRLAGATLLPLETLRRPRIDVMVTLSGIFRDLLPLQTKLLAEAAFLAASADEPLEFNFVRKHTLDYRTRHHCDLETAALRVFGNAEGAYGANVNHLVESGRWESEDDLANMYASRKGFAYGRSGQPAKHSALLQSILGDVSLAYQNLESVELGVTSIDHYFDTLGGISRAVQQARGGEQTPVYIGDQTRGEGTVRTLSEQVAIETRTRLLNPKWYEAILKHGYEGVHHIEAHVTNTMGWSATTGHVAPWVYQQLTQTFMLDAEMRERLARLNPTASARVANRLLEASERNYWTPDEEVLAALRRAGAELEDRLEGVFEEAAA